MKHIGYSAGANGIVAPAWSMSYSTCYSFLKIKAKNYLSNKNNENVLEKFIREYYILCFVMIYVAYIPDVPAWAQGLRSVGSGNYIAMSENIDIFSSSGSERAKRKIEKGASQVIVIEKQGTRDRVIYPA
jgi:hypothetical protein